MAIRLAAVSLALLGLPADALRSKVQAQNLTLQGWMDSVLRSDSEDPRMEELRQPGAREQHKKTKSQSQVDFCRVSAGESCPLSRMRPGRTSAVLPGGNTSCLNGDPFRFEVWPGDTKRVLIFFEGGGGCWDQKSADMGVCLQTVVPIFGATMGFFNPCSQGNVRNPFLDHTVIFVRYCSGDIHVGHADPGWTVVSLRQGGRRVKAVQRGYDNTRSAVDWARANLAEELDSLVIAGSSAGSLAAQAWSPIVLRELRPKSASVVMDSYVGVFPEGFEAQTLREVGACELPFFDSGRLAPLRDACRDGTISMRDAAAAAMTDFPQVTFAHLTSKYDYVQRFFYDLIVRSRTMKKVAHDYCGDQPDCDLSTVPASLLEMQGISPDLFYHRANEILARFSRFPNFHWYLIASNFHCWADVTFGDCGLLAGAPAGLPYFTAPRRESEQRWVSSLVPAAAQGESVLAGGICEDLAFQGLTGCDRSLESSLFVPNGRSGTITPAPRLGGLLAALIAAMSAVSHH